MGGTFGTNSTTMDAVNEKLAMVYVASEDFTIDQVGCLLSGCSGTGNPHTLDARVETVNTSTGLPTGTLWATNTNGTISIDPNSDDNTWKWVSITADATMSQGDLFAVVMNCTALAVGGTPNIGIQKNTESGHDPYSSFISLTDQGGGYAETVGERPHTFGLKNGSGEWMFIGPQLFPHANSPTSEYTVTSTGSTRRMGAKFQVPFPCSVSGVDFWIELDNDVDVILYDSDGTTALATKRIYSSLQYVGFEKAFRVVFDSDVSLSANTDYRVVAVGLDATGSPVQAIKLEEAAQARAHDGGENFYLTTHNGTSWTDTTTEVPLLSLVFNGFDDAAGGVSLINRRDNSLIVR